MNTNLCNCPVIYALSILNGKWKLSIIWHLTQQESIRFNELQRNLNGISNLMLSKSLQELQNDKIVSRMQYNSIPPRVEYSLTDLGRSLQPVLKMLGEWGDMAKKQATAE